MGCVIISDVEIVEDGESYGVGCIAGRDLQAAADLTNISVTVELGTE